MIAVALLGLLVLPAAQAGKPRPEMWFNRIATMPVYLNLPAGEDVETETVAEIIAYANGGTLLVHTDAATGRIGFVDITDPHDPQPDGVMDMGGEPTSVAVAGDYALVGVNTSPSFVAPSGYLAVVDIDSRTVIATHDLGGQPDAVAISPDGRYAAIAIENERDEDLGNGEPPQLPAGFLVIVDLVGAPADWGLRTVDLTGIADLFPEDPEPEYVDISKNNFAAVTLQENNHIVLVNLRNGKIVNDFSAGSVDLTEIDIVEDDIIQLTGSLDDVAREPDTIQWIGNNRMVTANEGDLYGGSRGFSLFNRGGNVTWDAGNSFEHLAVSYGHYPENRSENKGSEPEGAEYGEYGAGDFLFIGSERGNFVAVYEMVANKPVFKQILPGSGSGPEGLLAIPERNLFVIANENDDADDGFRSTVAIFELTEDSPAYPGHISGDDGSGLPISWGAQSALVADPNDATIAYSVEDSYYNRSRIFRIDLSTTPATITGQIILNDGAGGTFNLDPEGLAVRADGSFWLASEGDDSPPIPNRLYKVAPDGEVLDIVEMPASVQALRTNNGFEGVAVVGEGADEQVYVAIQREWAGDPAGHIRIGRYTPSTGEWKFFYYPKDAPESPAGGWVGLSEITHIEGGRFAVLERDNQQGPLARIKRIYEIDVTGVEPVAQGGVFPVLDKTLVRDVLPDLASLNGWMPDKAEGFAIAIDGETYLTTDNDGLDDAVGESVLLRLGKLFD